MLRKDSVVDKNKQIKVVKPKKIGPSLTFGIVTAFHTSVENTFKLLKLPEFICEHSLLAT